MGISNKTISERVRKVRAEMRERDLDALVLYAAPPAMWAGTLTSGNVRYLTNWSPPMNLLSSLLVLPVEGEPVLFAQATAFPAARRELSVEDVRTDPDGVAAVVQLLREANYERVGLVGVSEMPASGYAQLEQELADRHSENANDLIARLRMVKDAEEIEIHRKAAKIADAMLYAGMTGARAPEVLAGTLMLEMEHVGRRLGASFAHCWVDCGPAPEYIYHEPEYLHRPILDGEQFHSGTYVVFKGYWAHELRMGVKGKITPEMRRHFELALEVQTAGLNALKPGRPLRDVAMAMEKLIDGYSPYTKKTDPFRFRQGHGLGLEYSDPFVTEALQVGEPGPKVYRTESELEEEVIAEPGMIMELHPNFNTEKLGKTFLGDMVLVTEAGPEILTGFPRELFQI